MKLLLNGKVYETQDKKYISHLLSEVKQIFVERNQFSIFALEQKTYIEFTNSVFPTKKELMHAVTKLSRKGFKVHYYDKGGKV